ncbi:uncharacterized protein LOC143021055 isoform X2 [Oratosquilla oratoria]
MHSEETHELRKRAFIAYALCDAGANVSGRDNLGLTPLHYAVRRGDVVLCDALLQCGADMQAQHNQTSIQNVVTTAARAERREALLYQMNVNCENDVKADSVSSSLDEDGDDEDDDGDGELGSGSGSVIGPATAIARLFRLYRPGLWQAVATQNIQQVRRLINSWCWVGLTQADQTLSQLSAKMGNEAIASLLLSIQPSMQLVQHVLAGNVEAVRDLLSSPLRKKINVDIRKLSERGASLLYFAICSGDPELVRELRKHGSSIYSHMLDQDQVDAPVVFTALNSWTSADVIAALLPVADSNESMILERLWYRGRNVLRVAVDNDVSLPAVQLLLQVGGPALVCERDPKGRTVVDIAMEQGLTEYLVLIDAEVKRWLTRPDLHPRRRDLLALRGFGRLEIVAESESSLDEDVVHFLQEYQWCQDILGQLYEAVKEGEVDRVRQLLQVKNSVFNAVDILWQGRLQGDGMPLLHWAVIHRQHQIVELLLGAPFELDAAHNNCVTKRFCPDDVRDQWRRTPLHYAYALDRERTSITAALLEHGSSEHTLDMDGREPLDFGDARGSPALDKMMDNLRNKVYTPPDPNPWDPATLRDLQRFQRRERFLHHSHHSHNQPDGPQEQAKRVILSEWLQIHSAENESSSRRITYPNCGPFQCHSTQQPGSESACTAGSWGWSFKSYFGLTPAGQDQPPQFCSLSQSRPKHLSPHHSSTCRIM